MLQMAEKITNYNKKNLIILFLVILLSTAQCGGTAISSDDWLPIVSPGYPIAIAKNVNCRWTIDAPAGRNVYIEVTQFDVTSHAECQFDYLEFRDVPLVSIVALLTSIQCGLQYFEAYYIWKILQK